MEPNQLVQGVRSGVAFLHNTRSMSRRCALLRTPYPQPIWLHAAVLSCFFFFSSCARTHDATSLEKLEIWDESKSHRVWTVDELERSLAPRVQTVQDPNYKRQKRYRVVAMRDVLTKSFAKPSSVLSEQQFQIEAVDGYQVTLKGGALLSANAWLALADVEHPPFEPLGPHKISPGPLYLVWTKSNDRTHQPWPWSVARIRLTSATHQYARAKPKNASVNSPEDLGHRVFLRDCIRCHAINREGGHVGPELNVPQSIVEYRPKDQLRAFIRNPQTFRYSNMPAQVQLNDADLDHLLAYFEAMKQHKLDGR